MLAPSLEGFRSHQPLLRPLHPSRCHPESSEGSWLVRPLAPTAPFEQSLLCRHSFFLAVGCESWAINYYFLSPFPATLANDLQLTENPATLSPAIATLTSPVTHNSFVCHSCKKHPGHIFQAKDSSGQAFLRRISSPLATHHQPLSCLQSTLIKLIQNKRL